LCGAGQPENARKQLLVAPRHRRAAPRPARHLRRGPSPCGPPGRCSSLALALRRLVVVRLGHLVGGRSCHRLGQEKQASAGTLKDSFQVAAAGPDRRCARGRSEI
jgi:hypothetical protein